MSSGVFLQPLLLGPPILEPHLDNPHIQTRLRAQLFPDVSGRFRTLVIRPFQGLQLLSGNGGTGTLVGIIQVKFWKHRKGEVLQLQNEE